MRQRQKPTDVQARAIPGIKCGRCLGRIDSLAIDTKRRLHDRLHPGEPFEMPVSCSECWFGAILKFCDDEGP